jgi:hypothetical protein
MFKAIITDIELKRYKFFTGIFMVPNIEGYNYNFVIGDQRKRYYIKK